MSESLSKTHSRFTIFLIVTNLSIFLLLLFWLWQYWHTGLIPADDVDSFLNRKTSFLIFNKYVLEPYIFDVVIGFVALLMFLVSLLAVFTKKLVISYIIFALQSTLVLFTCIFIQSKIGVLHLWINSASLACSQNFASNYFIREQKTGKQNFDKASSLITLIILVLTFAMLLGIQTLSGVEQPGKYTH